MMQVLKFGGSSVADATRISGVLDIVADALQKGHVVLVCSAVKGATDALIEMAECEDDARREVLMNSLCERHRAIVHRLFTGEERVGMLAEVDEIFGQLRCAAKENYVCFGEILSTRIIAAKCRCDSVSTRWCDSRKLIRCMNGKVVEALSYAAIKSEITTHPDIELFVAPGFIASDMDGNMTTLGRGGSDYSAALYAAALSADRLEIWTDVPGIMTANPKVVPAAQTVDRMSYEAALSLASGGAKVLYAPTVFPAMTAGIAINIRNTFDPRHPGTFVCDNALSVKEHWCGVTSLDVQDGVSVLSLVGESVSSRRSASGRIMSALEEAGIKALGEVYGEGSVFNVKVRSMVVREAVCAVHREFFESRAVSSINVFIAGYGAVGRELVDMIERSSERVAERLGKNIRIVGVSNSRKFAIDMRGISAPSIARRLLEGEDAAGDAYIVAVCAVAPRRSVFVDCTDDERLYRKYDEFFRSGINVVTSNRRSLAVPFVQYAALKSSARENGAFFRYDTTVGNSMPVLESIAGGANCSDSIESIEAVISCTMNYIITGYDGRRSDSLAAILRKAQNEGLTEKDPRVDLGGKDVLRKLLILAREASVPLEESDVHIEPMLGREFFDCDIDTFYRLLAEYEPVFERREDDLDAIGKRQRFVASLHRDPSARLGYRAEIKMRLVDIDSPFYHISGTENVIVIASEYSSPLVIKGAGEGTRLAATGIIRDILL
ncbi:MAG TPA: hypothetical protein DCW53_04775 [Rikenellaceae bacterium]|nr:hypothetical protein [Rikenellaceae bacterium]